MRSIQRNAYCIAALSLVFASLTLFAEPASVLGRVVETFTDIPMDISGWHGSDSDTGDYASMLPNSSLLMRDYVNDSGRWASLSIVYGLDIADIHKPEYCLEGSGWGSIWNRKVILSDHPARMLLLNDTNGVKTICIYWYADADGAREALSAQRMHIWKKALLKRKINPSALIRILVPVAEDESTAQEDALSLASALDRPIRKMVSREPKIVRVKRAVGE